MHAAMMSRHAPAEAGPAWFGMLQLPVGPAKAPSRGLVRTFHGSPSLSMELSWASDTGEGSSPVDQCGASWNSRIAARTHQQEGPVMSTAPRILALSVSLTAILAMSTGSTGAADLAVQPLSIARSGSWRAPLECKTFAIGRTSPCSVRASRRRAGRHSLDCAIFRFRLVSWTCALRTVLAPSRGCGHFGQVLDGWRLGRLIPAISGSVSGRPSHQYIALPCEPLFKIQQKQHVTLPSP